MSANTVDNLSQKQEQAIVALLNETSVAKAAEQAGVNERTIYRWFDDPDFSKAYRKARRQAFGQAIGMLQRYSTLAAHTLAKVMMDEKTPCTSRVQASTGVLRFGREGIELDDLATRMDALERSALQANRSLPPLN